MAVVDRQAALTDRISSNSVAADKPLSDTSTRISSMEVVLWLQTSHFHGHFHKNK